MTTQGMALLRKLNQYSDGAITPNGYITRADALFDSAGYAMKGIRCINADTFEFVDVVLFCDGMKVCFRQSRWPMSFGPETIRLTDQGRFFLYFG